MSLLDPYRPTGSRFLNEQLWDFANWRLHQDLGIEKSAIVPGGGGDPSGAPPGASAGGGDPSQGGPPPGGAPPAGGAPPGGGGGTDPGMAAQTGAPAGPLDPAMQAQIMQMIQQAGGGGGAGGAMGKGKSPKDQIQAGQMKILMHLVAQMASKMGIQVDPQLLVPATDPGTDQMAMQEIQNSSMAPSGDPNAQGGGDPAQGGAGGAPGGAPAGPPGIQPMDASQGPIGKAASADNGVGVGSAIPFDNGLPDFRAISNRAFAIQALFRSQREG